MIDWNIQSRARACHACAQPFADKQSYHTLLLDHQHAYDRRDLCETCWSGRYQNAAGEPGYVSHWVGIYSAPPPPAPEPIGRETAESLLRKLVEQNDPAHTGARYILAAMLERKRLLKVKAQLREDGRRVFVYEHPPSGDLFQIADPELRLDQLEEVQRDVAQLLEQGLNPPPPVAASVQADPGAEPVETAAPVPPTSVAAVSEPA